MACLAAPDQANRRLALAERCSGREGQEVFSVLMEWLAAWLGRLVMARVRQQPMLCLADEEAAAVQTLAAQSTQTLLAVAESLRARAHEALGINLTARRCFWGFGVGCVLTSRRTQTQARFMLRPRCDGNHTSPVDDVFAIPQHRVQPLLIDFRRILIFGQDCP